MNHEEIMRQVWPVFSGEAREIFQTIAQHVMALEAGEVSAEQHAEVQRHAHSLKGMSGSVGVEPFVSLAHAIEDLLVASQARPPLSHASAGAILRALDAMEGALGAAQGPEDVRLANLPELLHALGVGAGPSPDSPEPSAPPLAGPADPPPAPPAPAAPSAPPPAPGSAPTPPARPRTTAADVGPPRDESAIRVPARTIDQLGEYVEALSLVADAAERRACVLLAAGEELQAAALTARGGAPDEPATQAALDRVQELARSVVRQATESQRDALRHKLENAAAREHLRELRMVPISLALEPLRRAVRDAATTLGKEVSLELEGEELRLDRRIVEAVKDPLVHLVRNAVDHGLEPAEVRQAAGKPTAGQVRVRVLPQGRRVSIQVSDDGAGLSAERIRRRAVERKLLPAEEAARLSDREAFQLAFTPGFSTAERVTAISGRGVGLDVVQNTVTRLQGTVKVSSTPGRGTTFDLDLPLALSVTFGILVRVDTERVAIPAVAVRRVLRLTPKQMGQVLDRRLATVGGAQLPFEDLAEVFQLAGAAPPEQGLPRPALLLELGGASLVLGVDEVLGEREIVVRGLGRRGAGAPLLAGAALLEDGAIVSVVNPAMLVGRSQAQARARPQATAARIVVADDSLTSRTAVKTILEIAGYSVVPAVDGEDAWRQILRGGIDLVVSDCQMPRLDGLGLARRLKSDPERRGIPIVLVTSLDAPEDRRAGLEAGADGYLVKKDVQSGSLLDLVRALLPVAQG